MQLDYVKVVLFLPNLNSLLQPLDWGTIHSFKVRPRNDSIMMLLDLMDAGLDDYASIPAKKFTILDAIRFVIQS